MHRKLLITILWSSSVICELFNNLIGSFKFINTFDELILGHWVNINVKVVLAAHNDLDWCPKYIVNDEILSFSCV